jgi:hypothetical protein
MANFFELLGFDSNDMADAMPEKIVQVRPPILCCFWLQVVVVGAAIPHPSLMGGCTSRTFSVLLKTQATLQDT